MNPESPIIPDVPEVDLSPDSLMAVAMEETGLCDWGDDHFREPLSVLIASIEDDARFNKQGRYFYWRTAIRLLCNRLRVENDLNLHPEIAEVPIRRPLFILGFPRTGTTFLHNLLSLDPRGRSLRYWEILFPSPPPHPDTYDCDPRIERAKEIVAGINAIAPDLARAHNLDPTGPEECLWLFEHDFTSMIFELRFNVPSYSVWFENHDPLPSYQRHKRLLQFYGWQFDFEHYVLKAPRHLFFLDALTATYPDACVVWTHRDPVRVVASLCSLSEITRRMYTHDVDTAAIGEFWLRVLSGRLERAIDARDSLDSSRFFDVRHEDLVKDPVGTSRRIYEYFGYPMSTRMEESMRAWMSQHRQHEHGAHRYTLERYGLDAAEVNRRFAEYRERFDV